MNRKRTVNFYECVLEKRLSLSALSHSAIITPAPIIVVVPVGTGSIPFPTAINDPANYPGPDGHDLPGFEGDPGPLPDEPSDLPITSNLGLSATSI